MGANLLLQLSPSFIATQPEPGTAGMLDLTIRGKSAVNIANRVQGNGRRRI